MGSLASTAGETCPPTSNSALQPMSGPWEPTRRSARGLRAPDHWCASAAPPNSPRPSRHNAQKLKPFRTPVLNRRMERTSRQRDRYHGRDCNVNAWALAALSRKLERKPAVGATTRTGPVSPAVPTIWRYRDMRPQLLRAIDLITAKEA